jgi:hypothetical protein
MLSAGPGRPMKRGVLTPLLMVSKVPSSQVNDLELIA